jgi:cell wall-associated NlpC family hydrolase
VTADRFVAGTAYQVSAGVAPIRAAPVGDAEQWSQALFGETVTIYDERDGFGWGQHGFDGYVGWVDMAALSAPVLPVTHRVTALRTYVFSEPRIKSAPVFLLSRNALLASEGEEGRFVKAARAGWVVKEHLAAPDVQATDPAAVAETFLGAPYQWGGKESLGLDCSGLMQMAYAACGIDLPRDSDMQRAVGSAVAGPPYRRGDIVCWKGHVGMMLDDTRLIHANAFWMATVIEPLADVCARHEAGDTGPIRTVRRVMG